MERLAIQGGMPAFDSAQIPEDLFRWPIYTQEDEDAILSVTRAGSFSGYDITEKFQKAWSEYQGCRETIACCNGTLALYASFFGIGLGQGDEIICPTKTYWASIMSCMYLGASPVFCNIDENLSLDPDDLERCIGPRTKAILVVHYFGYPADMDRIMPIAKKHGLKVIEDCSHAQGGLYKGKKVGTFGDVAAMSMMSMKSFATGEMGVICTDNQEIYERCMAFLHYERNNEKYITDTDYLKPYYHLPLGAMKGRVNQVSPAMGLVQLKYYDERCAEIRKAMNRFWDLLEDCPGIRALRVDESTGSNMAGWYCPHGIYKKDELGGMPVELFCRAVEAETGFPCSPGGNYPLHTHEFFRTYDGTHMGKPMRIAYADRDVRELDAALKPSEEIDCFSVPWFKHDIPEYIELYAKAFRKVAENTASLSTISSTETDTGRWYGFENERR